MWDFFSAYLSSWTPLPWALTSKILLEFDFYVSLSHPLPQLLFPFSYQIQATVITVTITVISFPYQKKVYLCNLITLNNSKILPRRENNLIKYHFCAFLQGRQTRTQRTARGHVKKLSEPCACRECCSRKSLQHLRGSPVKRTALIRKHRNHFPLQLDPSLHSKQSI